MEGIDNVAVRIDPDPDSNGSFNLHIPMYWGVINNAFCTNYFATVTQHITADTNGVVTISKGGIIRERNFLE